MDDETPEQRDARQQAESQRALEWLNSIWEQSRDCPICGKMQWNVGRTSELREYNGGGLILGSGTSIIPLTPITCEICGYTFLMNALRSGAITQRENGVNNP